MKKLLFHLALIGAISASKPAIAQEPAVAQLPAIVQEPAVPATNPVPALFQWKLQLKAGQKFLTTTDTSTLTSQQMPIMPGAPRNGAPITMENSAKSHLAVEQNVLSVDEKGARMEVVYREMTQESKMQQGDKVIYDSANPPAELKGLADMFKNIVGARISYLVTPRGEISDIQGVEAYLERINAGMEQGLAGATPQAVTLQKTMRESMSAMLSPEALSSSFGDSYRAMPVKAVAPGEKWKYTIVTPVMGTTFTQNGEGTFVSLADGVVTITQNGDFSTDAGAEFKMGLAAPTDKNNPNPPQTKDKQANAKQTKAVAPISQLDLRGTSRGEVTIDEQSGITLKNRTTQNMEGELIMSGFIGKGSTLTIAMKIQSEVVMATQEIKPMP